MAKFTNFKVTAFLGSPVATIDSIILDSVISAAVAKDKLKDDYSIGNNPYGTPEMIDNWLKPILDKNKGVFCTSIGFGDNMEFSTHYCKKFDTKNENIIKFTGKGKERIDIARGHFKNYHSPLVLKSYKYMYFYVRGDMEKIKRLLEEHISYLGKKGSQGYGEILKWKFESIDSDYSLIKDGKIMRPIPAKNIDMSKYTSNKLMNKSIYPPYWRPDCKTLCIMPED